MVRIWVLPTGVDHFHRAPGADRIPIGTVVTEAGKAREASAIVGLVRAMYRIPDDHVLTIHRVPSRYGPGHGKGGVYDSLCAVEDHSLAILTAYLVYVNYQTATPWQLGHQPQDFRLIDGGTAEGVGEVQTVPGPAPVKDDDHPVPCPSKTCAHPYEDHFVTWGFEVSCRVCGAVCGEVA